MAPHSFGDWNRAAENPLMLVGLCGRNVVLVVGGRRRTGWSNLVR